MDRLSTAFPSFLRVILLCGVLLLAGAEHAAAQVAKQNQVVSLKDGLKTMLQEEGATKLKKLTVNVDAEQAKLLKEKHSVEASGPYTVYQGLTADDKLVGSVVIVHEQGKEGPLQVLVALRPSGEIYDLGFTLFGEDKGKSALTWGYLKQYIGKTTEDPLMLGKDVDGISGATWTSTSVSTAVRKAVSIYDEFVE